MPPSLRDNPVYCLEDRRFRRLFPVAGEAFDRWGPTGIWVWVRLALWALLAVPPYVMSARLAGEAFASTGSLLMLAVAAFGGGLWLLPAASGRLTGERDRRTLDSLLLTRLSAAEIVGSSGLARTVFLGSTPSVADRSSATLVPPASASTSRSRLPSTHLSSSSARTCAGVGQISLPWLRRPAQV